MTISNSDGATQNNFSKFKSFGLRKEVSNMRVSLEELREQFCQEINMFMLYLGEIRKKLFGKLLTKLKESYL